MINHAQTPKLDANGKAIAVERVELMGALRWGYGCTSSEPGGTSSCPANLGHFESLGPIVF